MDRMRFFKTLCSLVFTFLFAGCLPSKKQEDRSYSSAVLITQKLGVNVYSHTTYLESPTFGKVPCNGMIVYDKNEAIIFDTPASDSISAVLIDWVRDSLGCRVVGIIPTHFHADCLGGLEEFHRRGIPSYASKRTIQLARIKNYSIPQNGFDSLLELNAGREKVIAAYLGEGHTSDNIIGYVPSNNILFGGCLVKELNAGKGNLEDANVSAWPKTIQTVKTRYPDANIIIPGHGKTGDTSLLNFTIRLFEKTN